MSDNQTTGTQKVLVELSIIQTGQNHQKDDNLAEVLKTADKTGLFYVRTNSAACIEGDWGQISPLIYECYQRTQERSKDGFLKISIR